MQTAEDESSAVSSLTQSEPTGSVTGDRARAPHALRARAASASTLAALCASGDCIQHRPRAVLPATDGKPCPRDHPSCGSPYDRDRKLGARALPARAAHDHPAAPALARPAASSAQPIQTEKLNISSHDA